MKKILLISHKAERTGAPILLLHLATLLKRQGWEVDFLVKDTGNMLDEFSRAGKTTVLFKKGANLAQKNKIPPSGNDSSAAIKAIPG